MKISSNYVSNEALDDMRRMRLRKFSEYNLFEKICAILVIVGSVIVFIAGIARVFSVGYPEITSVELVGNDFISYKEYEEGILDEKVGSEYIDLSFSDTEYEVSVHFADEMPVTVSTFDFETYLDKSRYIYADMTASVSDIEQAHKTNGMLNVKIDVKTGKGEYSKVLYSETVIMQIEDSMVESIEPLDKEPVNCYLHSDEISLEGRSFAITCSDGEKYVRKVETVKNEKGELVQYLDGQRIKTYYDDYSDSIYVSFMDAHCEMKYVSCPARFEKIEITDCIFDEGYNLKTVEYKLTYSDGTVKEHKSDVLCYREYNKDYVVDIIDGYKIYAAQSFVYPEESDKSEMEVTLFFESYLQFSEEAAGNFTLTDSDCGCICHNNSKGTKKFYEAIRKFGEKFGIAEKCRCGVSHYEIPDTYWGV